MVGLGAGGKVYGAGHTDDDVDSDDGDDSDDDVLKRERRTLVTGVTQIPSLAVTNVVTTHGALCELCEGGGVEGEGEATREENRKQ